MSAELWKQIKNEDWSLVSDVNRSSATGRRACGISTSIISYIGGQGADGVGYGAPAAVGAALANKKHGRLSVNIQCDGDLNYAPGVLWTAAHHRIPLLTIMHNNRAYHQELMYVEDMAARAQSRHRTASRSALRLCDPNIDYAKMAQGLRHVQRGTDRRIRRIWARRSRRAIEVVKKGEPALIDVVTQPVGNDHEATTFHAARWRPRIDGANSAPATPTTASSCS